MEKEKIYVKDQEKEYTIECESTGDLLFSLNEKKYHLREIQKLADNLYCLSIDGKNVVVEVLERTDEKLVLNIDGLVREFEVFDETAKILRRISIDKFGEHKGKVVVKAPMPGLIIKVMVQEGQNVDRGDKLLIIEAMKMENVLSSPTSGVVKKIHIEEGRAVEKDAPLIELES